jgi:tetratricopeptide (TPR) repeat protein
VRRLAAKLLAVSIAVAVASGEPIDDAMIEEAAREMSGRLEVQAASSALTARALEAFGARRFEEAERILLEQAVIDPDNFVPHYNLACARAVLGDTDEANASLRRAIELGFSNLGHLRRDPYLAPLHGSEAFEALVGNWERVLEMQRRARLERERRWIRGRVTEVEAADLRCDVLSAHDEIETERALLEMRRVDSWAEGLFERAGSDVPGASSMPYVVVALPSPQDFLKWAFWTYGGFARRAFSGIGGAYEHDDKRLVAQDLGATLRHEFFHVLHWRDMDRLGQIHPVWIQEGLASLVEDMDPASLATRRPSLPETDSGSRLDPRLVPGGEERGGGEAAAVDVGAETGFVPAASWRTNIVKRLGRAGKLKTLEELTTLDHVTFSTNRPLATYAQARTVLLYLHQRGVLEPWYRVYTTDAAHGFESDPSGLAAMEAVLGEEIGRLEAGYRDWLRHDLAEVPETGAELDAGLGVDLEPGEDGGPRVSRLPSGARRRTGLRLGDVVTAIDGRPVRDMKEYVRVMSAYEPGERVVVSYRRVKLHGKSEALLVATP